MDGASKQQTGRSSLWHVIAALILSVLTLVGSKWAPNLLPYDSAVSDYFRVTRANAVASQRNTPPDVTLVMVEEHFINQLPYRSPIDRCVLANGISSILSLNPEIVGVDFLFDKVTEQDKDDLLRGVIKSNPGKLLLAVNATANPNVNLPDAVKTEDSFSPGIYQASALLIKDSDFVVRNAVRSDEGVPAFAVRLAELSGKISEDDSSGNEFQIDWLAKDSGRREAFSMLPLEIFLDQSVNKKCSVDLELPAIDTRNLLRPQIENRIIILGANLEREDRHITPIDAVWHENIALSGAEIHANITQQLIDGRSIRNAGDSITIGILFIAFLGSLVVAAEIEKRHWPKYMTLLGPVALAIVLSGINWIGIYHYAIVFPTGLVAFAISANVLLELFKNMICKTCDVIVLKSQNLFKSDY